MEIIRMLYPKRCPVCDGILPDTPLEKGRNVCLRCNEKLRYIMSPRCYICGKQLYYANEEYCADCQKKKHLFKQGVGVFGYDDRVKASMYRFKYSNRREYAAFYGEAIVSRYGHLIRSWKPEVIIPVPMYKIKKLQRGYNQAELIADEVGRLLEVPVDKKLLVRSRATKAMKELDDEQRIKNLQNAFKITDSIVKYKKILLVDDIYTTGSTIDACSEVLLQAGAAEIYFACVCIGNGF